MQRLALRHDERVVDRAFNQDAEADDARDRLLARKRKGPAQIRQIAGTVDAQTQLGDAGHLAREIVDAAGHVQRYCRPASRECAAEKTHCRRAAGARESASMGASIAESASAPPSMSS